MNALGVWGQFFSMAILGLVLWAAVSDLLFRRIPNAAVVSIVLVEAAALAAAALGGNGGAALGLLPKLPGMHLVPEHPRGQGQT